MVEALIREMDDDASIWGVPGTLVTRRALDQHGYLDARSYLKTPRIFGFHGVYKRLAIHLGIVDVHSHPDRVLRAWWMRGPRTWLRRARRCEAPALALVGRSPPGFGREAAPDESWLGPSGGPNWQGHLLPRGPRPERRGCCANFCSPRTSAAWVPWRAIWELQAGFDDEDYSEEALHDRLEKRAPSMDHS